jgi:hypothetical protein
MGSRGKKAKHKFYFLFRAILSPLYWHMVVRMLLIQTALWSCLPTSGSASRPVLMGMPALSEFTDVH